MRLTSSLILLAVSLAFAAAPLLTPGFGGYEPAQFPVQAGRPMILPAGYAFALWGLIYLALIAHAIFGFVARADDPAWRSYRAPLILSLGLGVSWLIVAQASPVAATVQIWAMWAGACLAMVRMHGAGRARIHLAPIALYAGWLTAASCVSLGTVLIGYGLTGNQGGSLMTLALALALGLALQYRHPRAPAFGLAIIWALVAVGVANAFDGPVAIGAGAGGLLLVAMLIRQGAVAWLTRPR